MLVRVPRLRRQRAQRRVSRPDLHSVECRSLPSPVEVPQHLLEIWIAEVFVLEGAIDVVSQQVSKLDAVHVSPASGPAFAPCSSPRPATSASNQLCGPALRRFDGTGSPGSARTSFEQIRLQRPMPVSLPHTVNCRLSGTGEPGMSPPPMAYAFPRHPRSFMQARTRSISRPVAESRSTTWCPTSSPG